MKPPICYTKPSITAKEVAYVTDAAQNGWGKKCYDYIHLFEQKFKEYLNVPYAIATSSCTGALHMGLAALGIQRGDEVILADTNWIATAAPIIHLGAKPVFVDILPDTWCIDPKSVEKSITSKTKAIIAVHLYGNCCEIDALLNLSQEYDIPLIEDTAEAIGSSYKGKRLGGFGKFGTFSFHGTKTVTTGEGGIFVTHDYSLYKKVLTLSNHGRSSNQIKQFFPDVVGFKYKMSNLQAAVGCAQMERVEELTQKKREILNNYKRAFSHNSRLHFNPEPEGIINGAWMPTVVLDASLKISREDLLHAFKQENIDARVFFYPLSSLPMFETNMANINAWDIPARAINLPSYFDMSFEEQERVIQVIKDLIQ